MTLPKRKRGRPAVDNPAVKSHQLIRIVKPSDHDRDLLGKLSPEERLAALLNAARTKLPAQPASRTEVFAVLAERSAQARQEGYYPYDPNTDEVSDTPEHITLDRYVR